MIIKWSLSSENSWSLEMALNLKKFNPHNWATQWEQWNTQERMEHHAGLDALYKERTRSGLFKWMLFTAQWEGWLHQLSHGVAGNYRVGILWHLAFFFYWRYSMNSLLNKQLYLKSTVVSCSRAKSRANNDSGNAALKLLMWEQTVSLPAHLNAKDLHLSTPALPLPVRTGAKINL